MPLFALWLYYGCTLVVLWMYFGCTLDVLWMCFGNALDDSALPLVDMEKLRQRRRATRRTRMYHKWLLQGRRGPFTRGGCDKVGVVAAM